MERFLGAFEHSFWLYDQVHPLHFALTAKISGSLNIQHLRQSLARVQQQHPLLRVRIACTETGHPQFVEQRGEIPIRVVTRINEHQWQRELEVELSNSLNWTVAPLARVVVVHSEAESELIATFHHAIADGMSAAYFIRDLLQEWAPNPTDASPQTKQTVIQQTVAPALESLVLGEGRPTPAAVADSLHPPASAASPPPNYHQTASTRMRPQVRAMLLSAELTRQLRDRCHQEHTSVHGAISAAFLLTRAAQTDLAISPLKCLSPVNVRSQVAATVHEAVGLYITYGVTQHTLTTNSSFWEVARSLKSQLTQALNSQNLQEELLVREAGLSSCPEAVTIVQAMQFQYGYDLLVTNLGYLPFPQDFGSLKLEALYGPAVMAGLENEQSIGVATVGDRLSLTVSFPATPSSETIATATINEALQHLKTAITPQLRKFPENKIPVRVFRETPLQKTDG